MPIFLAILARKDPRSSLALSWEGAAGSVVIQAPIVIAISGWPHGIPWLRSGSRVGAGLRSPRSLRRPSEWSRGLSPTIRRLDLVNRRLFVLLFFFVRVCVEDFLLRLHVLDPFLWRSVAFRREVSGFPASSTPYVGSASGNDSPGFLVFRQVNLDSR